MSARTASSSIVVRLAPAIGLLAGIIVFVGVAVPQAHAAAAAPTMTTELAAIVYAIVDRVAALGSACGAMTHALDGWLVYLDPHGPGGGAVACPALRGMGLTVLGLTALVVIAIGRMRLAAETRRLDVVRRLVEQGLVPPRPLLEGPARRDRRKGVVLSFAGLGLLAAGLLLGDRGLAAGGLVPAFIGIGYLVSYRLAIGRRDDEEGG